MNTSKKKKGLISWISILVIIIITFSGILYIYINSEGFREKLKTIVITKLENNIGNVVEIGKIESISFKSIKIDNIVIYEDSVSDSEKDEILFKAVHAKADFGLLLPLLQWNNWQLKVHDITFFNASTSLKRESSGDFDFFKKIKLNITEFQENILINRIHFQDSYLVFHDELVYNYNLNYLTTKAKNINGYFDLSQLPKIECELQGIQEKDNALLGLQGQFSILEPKYSLNFHLENADITHFQYYLEIAEQFNVSKGRFNIDFNLSNPEGLPSSESQWKGNATFSEADLKPEFLKQVPFNQISGSVQFAKPNITVSEMTGVYYDNNVQLKGEIKTEPSAYFDLDISSKQVNISQLKDDVFLFMPDYNNFPLEGNVEISSNIKGEPDDFQINGELFSPEIFFENISFQNTGSSFFLHQNELIIESLETQESDSILSTKGNINWSKDVLSYHFDLRAENLSLKHSLISHLAFLEDSSGYINSNLQISSEEKNSSIANINGQFAISSIEIKDLSLTNPLKGHITSTMNFSDTLLSIQNCELESGQNKGSLKGNIYFDQSAQIELNFGFQIPEVMTLIESINSEMNLSGDLNIEGTLNGSFYDPIIETAFNLDNFSIQDNFLGKISGEMAYKEDILFFDTLELINQDMKFSGKGEIVLQESNSPEIDFLYQLHHSSIDPFIKTVTDNVQLSGFTSGNGEIKGVWPKLAIEGEFKLDQITYHKYQLGQGGFNFQLLPENIMSSEAKENNSINIFDWIGYSYHLELLNFNLQNESMEIKAEGNAKLDKDLPFIMDIEINHKAVNDMIEIFYPGDEYFKKFLPSQLIGKANIAGNLDEQNIILESQLIPQQQENNPPSKLKTELTLNNEGLFILDLSLIQSEGEFRAKGQIIDNQIFDINYQAYQLDISTLINLISIDEDVQGIVDIDGSLTGNIDQPQVSMNIQIKKGYFREFNFKNLLGNFLWDSQMNEIEIEKLNILLEEDNQIQAKGNLPLDVFTKKEKDESESDFSEIIIQEFPLDFQINMEKANLNLLRLFIPDYFSEISGNVDLELFITGTSKNPAINGIIDINQAKLLFENLPIQTEEINTKIKIANNKTIIPKISFKAYDNLLNISGSFNLVNFVPEDIFLTIQNDEEQFIYQDILESKANFWVQIKGTIFEPQFNGQLTLSDGEIDLQKLMKLYEGLEVSSSKTSGPPGNSLNYLDLNIEINEPFTLKMQNAQIGITGNLNLSGSFAEPSLYGNIVLKKGYLVYFEKRFIISEGRVTIDNFSIDDININAKASTNVQNYKIEINISGNIMNPQILLSSQPSLRKTEIISLLTFNRNIQGLSEGEINQILSQEMVDIIFQSLQMNLFKRIERELAEELGLEFIRLSYDMSEDSSGNLFFLENLHLEDLTLEVGKNISDDILLTYSTPLDFHGEASLGINYEISPSFTFNTQFDTFSLKKEDYRFKFGLEFKF